MSIKILSTGVFLALLVFVVVSGCGGSKSSTPSLSSNGTSGAEGYRISSASAEGDFVVPLIADGGDYYNDGGVEVGTVSVWNSATRLFVKFETDFSANDEFEGWTMQGLHLWVGEGTPTAVNPGGFPWKANADGGTEYTFDIPLSDSYPSQGKKGGGSYDFAGKTVNILAHAEVEALEFVEGEGEGTSFYFSSGLYFGSGDEWVGNLDAWVEDDNLVVRFSAEEPWLLCETQLYVGTEPPVEHQAGQFPYKHDPIDPPQSEDFYYIPLAELGLDPETWEDEVYIAGHATICFEDESESATAWRSDRRELLGHNWKSYTYFYFSDRDGDGGEWVLRDETAWGKGDDANWFRDNGFGNWGWWFEYNVD